MPQPPDPSPRARTNRTTTTFQRIADVEARLVSLLASKLKVDATEFDRTVPLGGYGLDSLRAVELSGDIENEFGVSFPILNLLEGYSLSRLAERILAQLKSDAVFDAIALSAPRSGIAEHQLSEGQRAFWSRNGLAPESAANNLVSLVRIRSELDTDALACACQALSDRHAALRTTFHPTHSGTIQRIAERVEVRLLAHDVSAWGETLFENRLEEESYRAFDLKRGPLLRASIFTRSTLDHVLLLAAHRGVADHWSMVILLRELQLLYAAEINRTAVEIPVPSLRFTDYARRQAAILNSAEGERLRDYWRTQLGGDVPPLVLPTGSPSTHLQAHPYASHTFRLDVARSRSLKEFSRDMGVTVFATLLTTLQVLFQRYSGQEEILIGTLAAGRPSADFAGVVGCFANPVLIRANLSGNPTFGSLLRQTNQTVLDALEHQDYPFTRLAETLSQPPPPGRSTLLRALCVLRRSPVAGECLPPGPTPDETRLKVVAGELRLEPLRLEEQSSEHDLAFIGEDVGQELIITLQYNAALFERETIERMAGHYATLLASALSQPDRRLSRLPLLTEDERRQLLTAWNQTQRAYPAEGRGGVLELFEACAERAPQAVAVVCGKETLSFAELNGRANQLARFLRRRGVRRETYVGINLERSTLLVIGILATLKAGGVYVPLDPRYPHERTAYMLADSGARFLLTQDSLASRWNTYGGQMVCLDNEWQVISQHAGENLCDEAAGDQLAYIIYTSGSSGAPKGVMIGRESLSHYIRAMNEPLRITPDDVYLHTASFAFSSSVRQLMLPLAYGATVLIANSEQLLNPLLLFEYIQRHGATIMDVVPSHWRNIAHALTSLSTQERSKLLDNKLRLILSASEPLLSDVPQIWAAECKPETRLINMYGQTETTGIVATYPISASDRASVAAVPIGRPTADTRFYLLDEHFQPVPVGVTGQLYINSPGLGRGYLNQPALTAERFLPDPFSAVGGARLYRTGDLARYLPNADVEYVGRSDEQVKLRGHRVELREIKAALSRHPSVREAVVTVNREEGGEQRVIAYVVARDGATAAELRHSLIEQLPGYMIPSAIVLLDALPLSANGKVDRRSLPAPDRRSFLTEKEYVAPRTMTEEILAGIWTEVLRLERVGIHDDFFELGGHSLTGTQALSRVRVAVGVEIGLGTLFECPTVAMLSEKIEAAKAAGAELSSERIPRIASADEIPQPTNLEELDEVETVRLLKLMEEAANR